MCRKWILPRLTWIDCGKKQATLNLIIQCRPYKIHMPHMSSAFFSFHWMYKQTSWRRHVNKELVSTLRHRRQNFRFECESLIRTRRTGNVCHGPLSTSSNLFPGLMLLFVCSADLMQTWITIFKKYIIPWHVEYFKRFIFMFSVDIFTVVKEITPVPKWRKGLNC